MSREVHTYGPRRQGKGKRGSCTHAYRARPAEAVAHLGPQSSCCLLLLLRAAPRRLARAPGAVPVLLHDHHVNCCDGGGGRRSCRGGGGGGGGSIRWWVAAARSAAGAGGGGHGGQVQIPLLFGVVVCVWSRTERGWRNAFAIHDTHAHTHAHAHTDIPPPHTPQTHTHACTLPGRAWRTPASRASPPAPSAPILHAGLPSNARPL